MTDIWGDSNPLSVDQESYDFRIDHIFGRYLRPIPSDSVRGARVRGCDGASEGAGAMVRIVRCTIRTWHPRTHYRTSHGLARSHV